MAILDTTTKQPWEAKRLTIDYKAEIGDATQVTLTSDIAIPAGMTLVSQATSGSVLQLYVSGGTDGQVYSWRVRTTLSTPAGELARCEDEFLVLVEEVTVDPVGLADVEASAGDKPPATMSAYVGGPRTIIIDCAKLLMKHELLTSVTSVTAEVGLTATDPSLMNGRFLQVTITPDALASGVSSTVLSLRASCASTRGTVLVAIAVKVYA